MSSFVKGLYLIVLAYFKVLLFSVRATETLREVYQCDKGQCLTIVWFTHTLDYN